MSADPSARVLVVEDEALIAMEIEAVLQEAGYRVAGPVGSIGAALALIDDGLPDAALLDVNVCGVPVFPVSDALAKAGVPFLVMTGHSRDALPPALQPHFLGKPFQGRTLREALAALLGR